MGHRRQEGRLPRGGTPADGFARSPMSSVSVISDSRLSAEMLAAALASRGIEATGRVMGEGTQLGDRSIVLFAEGASKEDVATLQRALDASDDAIVHVFTRQDHPKVEELQIGLGVPVRTMNLTLDQVLQLLDDDHLPGSDPSEQRLARPRPVGGEAGLVRELTPREREVLRELVAGGTYRDVAQRLGVSLGTVRTHTQSIRAKLGVSSVVEAVAVARRGGLRPPPGRHRALLGEVGR